MEIIKNIHEVVLLASSILALGGALLAALWAYAKFILERGLLPSIQFDYRVILELDSITN